MRTARIRDDQAANYHVMSRVVDRRRVFNDDEKERFLHNGAKVGSIGYGYHAKPMTSGNNIEPDKLAAGNFIQESTRPNRRSPVHRDG